MAKKPDIQQRVKEAYFLRIQGVSYTETAQMLAKQYKVSVRQAERYVEQAEKLILQPAEAMVQGALLDLARTEYLLQQEMGSSHDGKAARVIPILQIRKTLRKEISEHDQNAAHTSQTLYLPDTLANALSRITGTGPVASEDS